MIIIRLPFNDSNGDGVVDNTSIGVDSLQALRYDETRGEWVEVEYQQLNLQRNHLKFKSAHLSAFRLFGTLTGPPPQPPENNYGGGGGCLLKE